MKQDEEQRRSLPEYIFSLEAVQDKAEELAVTYEKLKELQDLLSTVLSCTTHGIVLVKEGKFAWCNKALTEILGWEADELMGQNADMIRAIGEEYVNFSKTVLDNPHQEGLSSRECEFAHKKGHHVACLARWRFVDENDPSKGYVVSITHFMERKLHLQAIEEKNAQVREEIEQRENIEVSLREKEEKYPSLVENLNVGVYRNTGGLDGRFLLASSTVARMHSYDSPEEFMRVSVSELYRDPHNKQHFVEKIRQQGYVGRERGRWDGKHFQSSCSGGPRHISC